MGTLRAARALLAILLALAAPLTAQAGSLTLLGAGSPSAGFNTWRYNGFTGQTPNKIYTAHATKTRQLYYKTDYIMAPSDRCVVWFDAYAVVAGSEVTAAAYNVIRMSVQGVTSTPVNFSASRTKTLTSGQVLAVSDEFTVASLGITTFPAQIKLKGVGSTAGGATDVTLDRGVMNSNVGGGVISGDISGYYQDPGDSSDVNQVDTVGPFTVIPSGAVGANVHFPSGIICRTTGTQQSLIALVDSIGDGYFAFNWDPTVANSGGLIRAAAWNAQKPLFMHGVYGSEPNNFAGAKSIASIQAQYSGSRLFTAGIAQSNANQFNGVNSLATIQATNATVWSTLADASHGGARPVYASQVTIPNETSTAGATTYPSQSKFAGGPAYFEAYNTWLDGKGPAGDNTVQGILGYPGLYDAAQSNKITVVNKSWTLGTTVGAGAGTLRLNGSVAPLPGEGIWIGGTGGEGVLVNTVSVVTPGSVWDVTLYGTQSTSSNVGNTVNAHTSGVAVQVSYQPIDRIHPTQNAHAMVAGAWAGTAPFD